MLILRRLRLRGRAGSGGAAGTRPGDCQWYGTMAQHHDRPVDSSVPSTPGPADRSWWQIFRSWPAWARVPVYVAVGLVLVLVAGLVTGVVLARRPLPQTDGELDLPGLTELGDRRPRRPRHPPALRRLARGPDARAGVRARAGAVLRDGRPPARDRRAGSRSCSARTRARDRRVRPHHGLAPGRRAGARADQAGDPRRARGVRRRRQRLPRLAQPVRARRRVHRPARRRARLPARAVDAGRLAGLAQGDGLGPARQHDRRDRPGAGAGGPHPGPGRAAVPAVPLRPERPDRAAGRGRRRRLRAGRHRRRRPGSRSGRRTPRRAARCVGCGPGVERLPGPARPRRRHRQQRVGGRRRALLDRCSRCWPTTRTSASPCPGVWMQVGLHCRDRLGRLPARRRGLLVLRRPGRDHRPQRRHRLGIHQPRARRQRPLPRARGRRPVAARRPAPAADDPHRDDRGPRRRRRAS